MRGFDSIYKEILNIVHEADKANGEGKNHLSFSLLKSAAFKLWFYQYQVMIWRFLESGTEIGDGDSILPNGRGSFTTVFHRHKVLGEDIISGVNSLEYTENEEEFMQYVLSFWDNQIYHLMEFINVLLTHNVLSGQRNESSLVSNNFERLRVSPSKVSRQKSYLIFVTILFVVAIIISTLILIGG